VSSAIDRIKDVTIGFFFEGPGRQGDEAYGYGAPALYYKRKCNCICVVVSVDYLHSVIVEAQGRSYPNPVGNCWKSLIRLSSNNYYYYYCKTQE
jgi:hypothetical protein